MTPNLEAQFKREQLATHVQMNKLSERMMQFDPDCTHPGSRFSARPFGEGGGVMSIALDTGDYVWVHSCYAFNLMAWPEIVQVTDGRTKGFSHEGNCIVSVPAEWCEFLTPEEADSIAECQRADEALRAGSY